MLLVPQSPPVCGQEGNRRGMLPARERREAWNVELVQGLTWINLYYLCRQEGRLRANPAMSAFDPGCVKTRNLAKGRESGSQTRRRCSSVCSSRTQSGAYEGILFSSI